MDISIGLLYEIVMYLPNVDNYNKLMVLNKDIYNKLNKNNTYIIKKFKDSIYGNYDMSDQDDLDILIRYIYWSTDFDHFIYQGIKYTYIDNKYDQTFINLQYPDEMQYVITFREDHNVEYIKAVADEWIGYYEHLNDFERSFMDKFVDKMTNINVDKLLLTCKNKNKLIIKNEYGINFDPRGLHNFPIIDFNDQIELEIPVKFNDFVNALYKIQSQKEDICYEMFTGIDKVVFKNNNIIIYVSFDHGS
jgi:hypothetical protein